MEFGKLTRSIAAVTALAAGGLVMEGCSSGQATPPTVEQIQHDSHYFEMTRPNGTKMECVEYGGSGYQPLGNGSDSFFGFSCDWDGHYPLVTKSK